MNEKSKSLVCTVPPLGWYCTRVAGHDGPCAAHQVAQQGAVELPQGERAAFEAYFCNTLSCDGSESEQKIEDCRVAAYDAWCEATRRALTQRAASVPDAAATPKKE